MSTTRRTVRTPLLVAIAIGSVLSAVLVAGIFLLPTRRGSHPPATPPPGSAQQNPTAASPDTSRVVHPALAAAEPVTTPASEPAAPAPARSLKEAEAALRGSRYAVAREIYQGLLEAGKGPGADPIVTDFLTLRLAQCGYHLNQKAEARALLTQAAASKSPLVRATACFYLARVELAVGEPLRARMHAYASLGAQAQPDETSQLAADIDFLIAQTLTHKIIPAGDGIPWDKQKTPDPLANLDESKLQDRLHEGLSQLSAAVLGPVIKQTQGPSQPRLTVTCYQAPLEEVLAGLTTQGGFDARFVGVDASIRRRPVTLTSVSLSPQRLCELAVGMTGLVANFTEEKVQILDPDNTESLQQQGKAVGAEAVSTWRRFFLRYPRDARLAEGHFALAAVLERLDEPLAAIGEYQWTANQFPRSSVAPLALVQCARVRMVLHDYAGARATLLTLRDSYPDYVAGDGVYITLAEATMDAGLLDEARKMYARVYWQDLPAAARRAASLGAGKCSYRIGDLAEASKWFTRCIDLGQEGSSAKDDLVEACWMLGKSETGQEKFATATGAFGQALTYGCDARRATEIMIDLADAQSRRECFGQAIRTLETLPAEELTPLQRGQVLLIRGRSLREMGLPEKSATALRHGLPDITDAQTRMELEVELARSYMAAEDFTGAYNTLSNVMPRLKGSVAHQMQLDLARVCLKTAKEQQAIALCRDLLKSSAAPAIKQQGRALLSSAYLQIGQYDQAAVASSDTPRAKEGKP